MSSYHTALGHVHLKVRDLARSVAFYTRYVDLRVTEEVPGAFAFLSGDARHHQLALRSAGDAAAPDPSAAGLQHIAFEVPDRRSFAQAYNTVTRGGVPAVALDEGVCWAMYFSDPDGNTVAIYWDTRGEPSGTARWDGRSLPLGAVRILEGL